MFRTSLLRLLEVVTGAYICAPVNVRSTDQYGRHYFGT